MSRKNQFNRLQSHRLKAFNAQSGRCFYCGAEMWLAHPERFASRHRLNKREVARFKCTAEHLVARRDGGTHLQTNIVAACRFCNATRHKFRCAPEPTAYVQHVHRRLTAGRWHPNRYRHLLVGDAVPERPVVDSS